ncbi:Methyl-accepting chemotaxis protein [Pseudomonas cichorii]|uniref:Methyl-accepting chemotaxis protein n=2 Tax=Pseudomonas cichorii TaxID=36746 RepID=A0A3M4M4P0_PSECI|nr:Methyl-accepting chemotaxis protein [Pseudomonas cichorii]
MSKRGRTPVEVRSNSTHPQKGPFRPFRTGVQRHHDMRFASGDNNPERTSQPHPASFWPLVNPAPAGFSFPSSFGRLRAAFFILGVPMDPTDLGPGTATWLGGTGTILLGGFLWLRKFLSRDAADRAMDNADIGTVRRLNELLDSEREARKEAEARADQFARERNELAAAVGRMEGKVEVLTNQIAQLTDKVTTQSAEIARLRSQLGGSKDGQMRN